MLLLVLFLKFIGRLRLLISLWWICDLLVCVLIVV